LRRVATLFYPHLSEHSKLEDVEEQNLWNSFDNSDIYEFITGNLTAFRSSSYWIQPCQLAVHLPPGVILAHPQDLQPPPDENKSLVQLVQPPLQSAQVQFNLCRLLLCLRNLQHFHPLFHFLLRTNHFQNLNQLLDQVAYNNLLTNTIFAFVQKLITKSFIQE